MNTRWFLIMLLGTLVPLVVLTMIFLFKMPVNTGAYYGLIVLFPIVLFFLRNEKGHVPGNGLQSAHVYMELDNQK